MGQNIFQSGANNKKKLFEEQLDRFKKKIFLHYLDHF